MVFPEPMATKISFIKGCSENISRSQDQALAATIYILREYGPTGFLLKEEQEEKNFKVFFSALSQIKNVIFSFRFFGTNLKCFFIIIHKRIAI